MRIRTLLVALIALALGLGAQPAAAEESSRIARLFESYTQSENPDEYFASLNRGEQRLLMLALTPASSRAEREVTMSASAGRCYTHTWVITYENLLGKDIARYAQSIAWCDDGSRIVSPSYRRARWGNTYLAGWKFAGHIGDGTSQSSWHFNAWTQGKFELCLPVVGCIQQLYPYISDTGYVGGKTNTYWFG